MIETEWRTRPGSWRKDHCEVRILVFGAGVAGTIPRFTTKNLEVIMGKKQVRSDERSLTIAAYAAAIKAYVAWRKEG